MPRICVYMVPSIIAWLLNLKKDNAFYTFYCIYTLGIFICCLSQNWLLSWIYMHEHPDALQTDIQHMFRYDRSSLDALLEDMEKQKVEMDIITMHLVGSWSATYISCLTICAETICVWKACAHHRCKLLGCVDRLKDSYPPLTCIHRSGPASSIYLCTSFRAQWVSAIWAATDRQHAECESMFTNYFNFTFWGGRYGRCTCPVNL